MTAEQKHQHWQAHIDNWQQSQLSQKAYCNQQEIALSTFSYWRNRLAHAGEGRKKLLPVTIPRPTTVTIMLPSGIRLEVPAHALEDILPVLTRAALEKA